MKAVVDASVSVKWVVEEEHSNQAAHLLGYDELHAPDHWLAEAVNVLWAKVYKSDLDAEDARERMTVLMRAPVLGTPVPGLLPAAFAIAVEHSITVYDALYVALARERGIPLVTDDGKLVRRLSSTPLSNSLVPVSSLRAV